MIIHAAAMSGAPTSDLAHWVRSYTKEMLAWATRRTSDPAAAEDLVQETFLVASEKLASFRGESHPRTWLFAILNNKIAEHYRQKERQPGSSSAGLDPTELAFSEEGHWKPGMAPMAWTEGEPHLLDDEQFVRIFERCLAELPVDWHQCLTAKFIQQRPAEQICQELGLSTTNYWQIIHRAKMKMRNCLQHHWFSKEK